jgi:hypothetical protein
MKTTANVRVRESEDLGEPAVCLDHDAVHVDDPADRLQRTSVRVVADQRLRFHGLRPLSACYAPVGTVELSAENGHP